MTLMPLARAERADLLELLTGLTPQQWDGPTLCTGWRVRDVVAHMISYEGIGFGLLEEVVTYELESSSAGSRGDGSIRVGSTTSGWPSAATPARTSCSPCWNSGWSRTGSPPASAAASPCSTP